MQYVYMELKYLFVEDLGSKAKRKSVMYNMVAPRVESIRENGGGKISRQHVVFIYISALDSFSYPWQIKRKPTIWSPHLFLSDLVLTFFK